jgi:hypothetical protein
MAAISPVGGPLGPKIHQGGKNKKEIQQEN